MASLHAGADDVQVVNVRNDGALPDLPPEWVVEVPARIDRDGAHALPAQPLAPPMRELVEAVKSYELLTIDAATTGDRGTALRALEANPLVPAGVVGAIARCAAGGEPGARDTSSGSLVHSACSAHPLRRVSPVLCRTGTLPHSRVGKQRRVPAPLEFAICSPTDHFGRVGPQEPCQIARPVRHLAWSMAPRPRSHSAVVSPASKLTGTTGVERPERSEEERA